MLYGNTRKIVVIKDIPSNLVEEAILVLKTDIGKESIRVITKANNNSKISTREDCVLQEAKIIIDEYINELRKDRKIKKNLIKSNKINPKKVNLYINTTLIGSVILLALLILSFFKI